MAAELSEEVYKRARDLVDAGDYAEGLAAFRQLQALEGDTAQVLYGVAARIGASAIE